MALSKPRRITVNEVKYNWKLSKNGHLHLVIINPANRKQKIVVHWSDTHHMITPKVVRSYIEKTLEGEWTKEVHYKE